jgi:hypothetical protein
VKDVRFRVDRTLSLSARPLFFLLGDVVQGEVRTGMKVSAGRAEGPSFRQAVEAIELVDERASGRAWVALGFRYLHSAQLGWWQGMDWAGATLEIPSMPILHPCPCCGFRTLAEEERGSYALCPVCGWEDDRLQHDDPDYAGGANVESLNEKRAIFFAAHPHLRPNTDG